MRRVPVLICLLAVASACAAPAAAQASGPSPAEVQRLEDEGIREIIVARDPGLSAAARGDMRAGASVTHVEELALPDTEVVRAPAGGLVEAVDALEAEPGVRYAEPNGIVRAATNDPFWPLWGLENLGTPGTADADIDAPEAWARSTGAGQQVAVVDGGTTFDQADLQDGALAASGVDFVDGDSDPTDPAGHGTHVTGTIVARKDNGIGIAGVAPSAQVVPFRVLDAADTGSTADIASAFTLAGARRIPIVNASFQTSVFSQAIDDAIRTHPDTLYVAAAGNAQAAATAGTDNDANPVYPCALPEPNVICVGASDRNDLPAAFSNFGRTSVDLFAPGVDIVSTYVDSLCLAKQQPPPCFAADSGTSMAAPHVSGTLALMRALDPTLTPAELKAELLATVDRKTALADLSSTGGRLNAAAAVAAAAPAPVPAPPAAAVATSPPPPADPTPTPATAAAATPAVVPAVAVAPVLGRPTLAAGALTARHPLTIRFTLDRAATVKVTIARGTKTVATASIHGRRGANRYVLRTKVGGKRLARGRYRVRVQAAGAARAYTLAITVR